ncbi:hypothetical protein CVT26_012871 [Gymnopilus dilepis]|uniref:F-box domain-containing protein n=1 Tax=Gymnopilus dilepis TaxID=231916 RepID=A0A409X482_9AGAR|nr:hypothetical protein CVT26_012871 [Gymnopilus dilepis]
MSTFPVELVHKTLLNLKGELDALWACNTASRQFRSIVRPMLYQSVDIERPATKKIELFIEVLAGNIDETAPHIQRLRLKPSRSDLSDEKLITVLKTISQKSDLLTLDVDLGLVRETTGLGPIHRLLKVSTIRNLAVASVPLWTGLLDDKPHMEKMTIGPFCKRISEPAFNDLYPSEGEYTFCSNEREHSGRKAIKEMVAHIAYQETSVSRLLVFRGASLTHLTLCVSPTALTLQSTDHYLNRTIYVYSGEEGMSDVTLKHLPSLTHLKFNFGGIDDITPPFDLVRFFCVSGGTQLRSAEIHFEQSDFSHDDFDMLSWRAGEWAVAMVYSHEFHPLLTDALVNVAIITLMWDGFFGEFDIEEYMALRLGEAPPHVRLTGAITYVETDYNESDYERGSGETDNQEDEEQGGYEMGEGTEGEYEVESASDEWDE